MLGIAEKQMKTPLTLVPLTLLLALGAYVPGAAQNTTRTLSIPGLTVQVSLTRNYAGEPMLIEDFSTNDPKRHSVYCTSGLLDLQYVLRDASGRIVKQDTSEMGSDIVAGDGGYVRGAPDPCKTVQSSRSQRRVLLSDFYPNLPHGTYQLQITLAPRGQSERTQAAPVTINI
jgi:hypothetical protein